MSWFNRVCFCEVSLVFLLLLATFDRSIAVDCGQEELTLCAKPLQVLTATTELSFITNKEELERMCPDLEVGLRCIHSYTRRCMSLQQRTHFHKLYHGTNMVIKEMCQEGKYQDEFLKHAPCMRYVKSDYEICSREYQNQMSEIGKPRNHSARSTPAPTHRQEVATPLRNPAEITEDEAEAESMVKTVCCSFHQYLECSEQVVKESCGEDTAKFTKGFLNRMASSIIKLHCENYDENSEQCRRSASPRITSNAIYIIGLAIIVVTIIL